MNEILEKLLEDHGLRQHKTKTQRYLLWFKEQKWARKLLGGQWAKVQLDDSYAAWVWAVDKAEWLESGVHKILEREAWNK